MFLVPDYRLEPPTDPKEIGLCCGCGGEVYSDEPYAIGINGDLIHKEKDCLVSWAAEMFEINRKDVAW